MVSFAENLLPFKPKATSTEQPPAAANIPPVLEQKPFFWDNIIFYLLSAILGLSVSGIIVEFLRPEHNLVACFHPLENRAQNTYISSYCHKYLPPAEYFSVALIIHAAALFVPHNLWRVYVSAQVDFFFSHVGKLETLRERDTGEYPHKNLSIVDILSREFHDKKIILRGYILKLSCQIVLAVLSLGISLAVFRDFDIEFNCPHEDDEENLLFGRVKCSYARVLFISLLQYVDYSLLALSVFILVYGWCWCVFFNHPVELGYESTTKFCYESCINSKYYKPKKRYRLNNDFDFLLVSLFATNSGLGKVFKSVQVASAIADEVGAHFESLDSYDSIKHSISGRERDKEENQFNFFRHIEGSKSFGEIMHDLCESISVYHKQVNKYDSSKLAAMDIASGYHSYLFAIARWKHLVISIVLDPYYRNEDKMFKTGEYHAGVMLMKIPTNLFGLPKQHKQEFNSITEQYVGLSRPGVNGLNTEGSMKFSLLVIGPLDSERKVHTVNQIIEMHSRSPHYFIKGAIMLIIIPVSVGDKNISRHFAEWKPESKRFWIASSVLYGLNNWPKDPALWENNLLIPNSRTVSAKCGESLCKFQIKAYEYRGFPEIEDDCSISEDNLSAANASHFGSTADDVFQLKTNN